jgi:excisionase family DNA binding protein
MTTNGIPEQAAFKPVYSVTEVAELLGLHRATISSFISKGELRSLRLGHRTVRVTHEALMDFLRAKEDATNIKQRRGGKGEPKA